MEPESKVGRLIAAVFNRFSPRAKLFIASEGQVPEGLLTLFEHTWDCYQAGDWEWNDGRRNQSVRWANYSAFLSSGFYQDGLLAWKNTSWLSDPRFVRAYAAARNQVGVDYRLSWRTHVALWAAEQAFQRPGAYLELGTGRGWMAAALLEGLGPDLGDKREVFLLDRFEPTAVDAQTGAGSEGRVPVYADDVHDLRGLLNRHPRVRAVVGDVSQTLPGIVESVEHFAFVHFDLNAADPEVEALARLWPKCGAGTVFLLDDYGFPGLEAQQRAWDEQAVLRDFDILAVPTGQGLVIL